MLTLLGSLLGFISSIFPQVLRIWQDKGDRRHELELFDLQIKMAKQGQLHQLDQMRLIGEMAESQALYAHAQPVRIAWVDALSGSVRPIITYTFFLLYTAVKVAQGVVILTLADSVHWSQVLIRIWHEEDQALFAAVMAFWFGQRSLYKMKK